MRRLGRIKKVDSIGRGLPLSSFFFDCLYVDGEGSLISLPYQKRVEVLSKTVSPSSLLPRIVTGKAEEAERFLQGALKTGDDGVMAKSWTAPYVAGERGSHWLKLKAAGSLDWVVLAAGGCSV